jgi:hypothetical protein
MAPWIRGRQVKCVAAKVSTLEGARLARLVDDEVGRQRKLREAHRLFAAMGATARAEQVAILLNNASATR